MTARRTGSWLVFVGAFLTTATAQATCGSSKRPWISLEFEGSPDFQAHERRMLEDLRAGLSDRAIDVCPAAAGPAKSPVAAIRIAQATATKVGVSVEVRDAVTEKRVARDVDLSAVPKDGRAFAVALAADELLRASWVELAFARASRPKRPPPPEVEAVVESTLEPRESSSRVGIRGAAERFTGGQVHLGADAAFVTALGSALQLELSGGLREALAVTAPNGSVVASAIGASAMLGYLLFEGNGAEVSLAAGARAAWVRFRGEAEGDAIASELTGLAVYARAGLGAAARIVEPVWVDAGTTLGAPLRSLGARDGDRTVTATSGLELAFRLGLAAEF